MRCNWRRWLWGLIPLIAVGFAAVHLERDAIERDLAERAKQSLGDKGMHWADVRFDGRDVDLRGSASDDSQPTAAETALRRVWGVREVDNNAVLPPRIEPFVWHARRKRNQVRLHGYVPNRATRQVIIGMAKAALPGLEVVDRMRVARGAPPADTWTAGSSFALKQLAALERGRVRLEGLALSVSGKAESPAAYRAVSAALKGDLPKGITLGSVEIAAPAVSPYTWSAQFAGGQLVLSGHVTGEPARAKLLAAAAAGPAGTDVVDKMDPAGGAPSGFADVAAALLRELVRLQSGSAEMKDAALTVGGVAADEAQAKAVRAGLRAAVVSPFKLTDQIRVREPKTEPKPAAEPVPPAPPRVQPPTPSLPLGEPATKLPAPALPSEPQPKAAATAPAPAAGPQPEVAVPAPAPPAGPEPKVVAPAPAPPPSPEPKMAATEPAPPAEPHPKVLATPPAPPTEPEPKMEVPAPSAEAKAEAPAAPAGPRPPPGVEPAPRSPEPRTAAAAAGAAPPPQAPAASACKEDLDQIAGSGRILFDTDSASLDSDSFETLDSLAAAAKLCPGVRIVVEGHADVEGSAEYNQRLSIRRAEAVVAYLIEAGADAQQLQAVGHGASRPAAPNDTVENKARNRRIEIVVRR